MTITIHSIRPARPARTASTPRSDAVSELTSAIEADRFEFYCEAERGTNRDVTDRRMPREGSPMIDAGEQLFAINWA